jgi:hypothetical protein
MTRSTIPLATTVLAVQLNRLYLTDELPQFRASMYMASGRWAAALSGEAAGGLLFKVSSLGMAGIGGMLQFKQQTGSMTTGA